MNNLLVNLEEKFTLVKEYWTPHIVGEFNDNYIKVCKLNGEFVWHSHKHEDEVFLIQKGILTIDFRNQPSVEIRPGEFFIVPRGVEHRPRTGEETVYCILFEPKSTQHTGDVDYEVTVKNLPMI